MIYKRIEIGPRERPRVDQRDVVEAPSSYSPSEADRIWRLLRQTAEGTCAPVAPVEHQVDQSGWESA
jgi:hypothetical protein